jgi:hypothetical protein
VSVAGVEWEWRGSGVVGAVSAFIPYLGIALRYTYSPSLSKDCQRLQLRDSRFWLLGEHRTSMPDDDKQQEMPDIITW